MLYCHCILYNPLHYLVLSLTQNGGRACVFLSNAAAGRGVNLSAVPLECVYWQSCLECAVCAKQNLQSSQQPKQTIDAHCLSFAGWEAIPCRNGARVTMPNTCTLGFTSWSSYLEFSGLHRGRVKDHWCDSGKVCSFVHHSPVVNP